MELLDALQPFVNLGTGPIEIVTGIFTRISALVFFVDPLTPMPHDVDVKALTRLAVVYDIPMALNAATAEILIRHPGDFTTPADRGEAA